MSQGLDAEAVLEGLVGDLDPDSARGTGLLASSGGSADEVGGEAGVQCFS